MKPDPPTKRPKCNYGARCYRKNPEHRRQFWHPGDPDEDGPRKRKAEDNGSQGDAPVKRQKKSSQPKEEELSSPSEDDYKTDDESTEDPECTDDDDFIDDASDTEEVLSENDSTPQTSPQKPVCKYGTACYRKNPQHFIDFAHPWRDKK